MFFGAKANENRRPGYGVIKGGKLVELDDDKEIAKYFYSGAIVQLSLSIFCYEAPTVGYSFWMDGLILEGKGKKTYGRPDLSQAFDLKKLLTTVVDVDEDGSAPEEEGVEDNNDLFGNSATEKLTGDSDFDDDIAF